MKILIVDDSALMRGIMRRTIQEHGAERSIEIVEASDGDQALSAVESGGADVAFVDWNMPVLDGLEFVKKVRGQGLSFPIIMVTAVSDKDKVAEAAKAGVTDYIEKPVSGADLWQRISGYLS